MNGSSLPSFSSSAYFLVKPSFSCSTAYNLHESIQVFSVFRTSCTVLLYMYVASEHKYKNFLLLLFIFLFPFSLLSIFFLPHRNSATTPKLKTHIIRVRLRRNEELILLFSFSALHWISYIFSSSPTTDYLNFLYAVSCLSLTFSFFLQHISPMI